MRIDNAIIRRCDIMVEDHGFIALDIDFDYGGSGQGWPLILAGADFEKEIEKASFGMCTIGALMWVTGREHFSKIAGTAVRVVHDTSSIEGIFPLISNNGIIKNEKGFFVKALLDEEFPDMVH